MILSDGGSQQQTILLILITKNTELFYLFGHKCSGVTTV